MGLGWGETLSCFHNIEINYSLQLGFGWTPGVGDGQGGLGCFASRKELDTTERLN